MNPFLGRKVYVRGNVLFGWCSASADDAPSPEGQVITDR
jgi:hypothetical protein